MVDKNKAVVCCLLAISAIMLSEKKLRKSGPRTPLCTIPHFIVKHKVTLEQAIKAQRGSDGTALLFL
jgi:hypothetical protein